MTIGSGFSRVGSLYIAPRYPEQPVRSINRIDSDNGGNVMDINQPSVSGNRREKPLDHALFNEISGKMKFDTYESFRDLGTLNTLKALNENVTLNKTAQNLGSSTASHITLTLPDGRFIVGYLVDLFA